MKNESTAPRAGVAEAKEVFAAVIDKLNAGSKFGGFFPNGIELIKVVRLALVRQMC